MSDNGTVVGAGVGADLEVGKWDLLARIGIALENQDKRAKADDAREARRLALLPIRDRVAGQATYATGSNSYINLGTPKKGYYREIREIIVGGVNITDTPAGTAYALAVPGPPSSPNLGVLNLRDFTANTFPQVAYYGRREFIVKDAEYLVVAIVSGTNLQVYTAVAHYDEFREMVDIASVSDAR